MTHHPPSSDSLGPLHQLTAERDSALHERDAARRDLRFLQRSAAYRTGKVLTWVPRQLMAFSRRAQRLINVLRRTTRSSLGHAVAVPPRQYATRPSFASARVPTQRVAEPDVTVVIPVYNSAPWLEDCLTSVLAQTGVTLEVICINDGSTDDSDVILRQYAAQDPRVSLIEQPNSGQSVGRNAGLDAAAGRYLIYLDSDDFWPADSLAGLVHKADEETLDVLLFDCYAFRDGSVAEATWKRYSTYYQRSREYREIRSGAQMIADMRRHRDYRPHVGMYLTRTAHTRLSGARFIPGIVHQDNPYSFALLLNAARTAHVQTDVYARRIRPGSTITSLESDRSARGYFVSYLAMTREIAGREFSADVTELLSDVIVGVFDGARKSILEVSDDALRELGKLDESPEARIALRLLTSGRVGPRERGYTNSRSERA